jgi:NTE family protein
MRQLFRPLMMIILFCPILPTTSAAADSEPQQRKPAKVGLVLSGGGARGISHIGILRVLERERIPIDCIAGTSFGALIGGLYSLGYSADEIEAIILQQDWDILFTDAPERRLVSIFEHRTYRYQGQLAFQGWSPELPTGLSGGQRLTEIIDYLTTTRMLEAQNDFDRLPIPFRAVATNLLDGKPYIFKSGRMGEAIRASTAIPMLFTPVEKDNMLLVDGGLADNLPTDVVRDMGADLIIAVDATAPLFKIDEFKSLFNVMDQSLTLLMHQTLEKNKALANIILRPDLEGYKFDSFARVREILEKGEQEAEKRLPELKALLAELPPRALPAAVETRTPQIIDSISFRGLKRIQAHHLENQIRVRTGQPADPALLRTDVGRLYATRLFDTVEYSLEPMGEGRCRLSFILKEAPLNTVGGSIRYDWDYKFVALAEFTAHQILGTPSWITLSSQFGGLEDHSLTFRYIPSAVPFLFLEPKAQVRRRERLDIRDKVQADKFTDKREGGQLLLGGSFFKTLEFAAGYRAERVHILGGTPPNRQEAADLLAGLTLRLNRDSLDEQAFPHSGMSLRIQLDKKNKALGSDFTYSKGQLDYERFFSFSDRSTMRVAGSLGYSHGEAPFYERFYFGGHSFSGYQRDEFAMRELGIAGLSLRHQIFSHSLGFLKRGFLTGFYNAAYFTNNQESPYDFQFLNGIGVGFSMDTMLGPVRVGTGLGESRRLNFYLSLGPGF